MDGHGERTMSRKILAIRFVLVIAYIAAVVLARYLILDKAKTVSFNNSPVQQALNNSFKLSAGYLPIVGKDYSIAGVKYFDGGQWAVVSLKPIGTSADPGTVVLTKQAGGYRAVLGPSNFFQASDTASLPADVANYLEGVAK